MNISANSYKQLERLILLIAKYEHELPEELKQEILVLITTLEG